LSGGHVSGGLFLEFEARKFRNLERLTCASRERDGDAKTEEDDDIPHSRLIWRSQKAQEPCETLRLVNLPKATVGSRRAEQNPPSVGSTFLCKTSTDP
jgi:hypothetical protein